MPIRFQGFSDYFSGKNFTSKTFYSSKLILPFQGSSLVKITLWTLTALLKALHVSHTCKVSNVKMVYEWWEEQEEEEQSYIRSARVMLET